MVENKGNLITRRAFADTDRMPVLRRVVNKAMSTAYQMTEEVGDYGSGTPSPLHMLCELIRESYELNARERRELSTALELAEYPLCFLHELMGESPAAGDSVGKINFLMKTASDANYLLKARLLENLTPGELKDFARLMRDCATVARELVMLAEARAEAVEGDYPGAPVQGERLRATG